MLIRNASIAVWLCCLARAATIFDPANDCSLHANPSGVWQYGYSAVASLDPAQFRLDKYASTVGAIRFWHPEVADQPGPGYYPYIACNTTTQPQMGSSNGWALRAGEIAMEASNTGQYSMIRFVAPTSGIYKITARFAGIHFRLSTTDVHVLHHDAPLFDAEIDGYGGDTAFHQVEGANPAAAWSAQIEMKANDTITFAVGYGQNKTHFNDTTGLFARIVLLKKVRELR